MCPSCIPGWPRLDTSTVRHFAVCGRCGAVAARCLWRRSCREQAKADASRFGLHPALLDAILHGIAAGGILAESELTRLPFEWAGVSLDAVGATRLRARITLVGDDTVAVTLTDSGGASVGRIDSIVLRGVSPSRLLASTDADDALYGLEWVALPPSPGGVAGCTDDGLEYVDVLRCPTTISDNAAVADGTRRTLTYVLDRVQHWLLNDCHDDDARLVVLTCGAIAVDSCEDVTDLGQAAVWGLLRSAQTEHPGRIWLADVDDWASADFGIAEAASREEPQLALRDGVCFAPRLRRAERIEGAELVEQASWRLVTLGKGHWSRGTSPCARGPNPSVRWNPVRCGWVFAAAV